MTPEQIEQWALDAGMGIHRIGMRADLHVALADRTVLPGDQMARFAALAFAAGAEAMRRDAAHVCEDRFSDGALNIADAIRALPLPKE